MLKSLLNKNNIDGYIIPSNDKFNNEFVAPHLNRLRKITGFTGSNGVAVITKDIDVLYTDGRYLLQAKQQLPDFTILAMHDPSSCLWFDQHFNNKILGLDPMLHSKNNYDYYLKYANKYHFKIQLIEQNLVDIIEKPVPKTIEPMTQLYDHITGLATDKKLNLIKIPDNSCMFINDPASICWLLNVRGSDIPFTPFVLSYLIIDSSGSRFLYVNPEKAKNIIINDIVIKDISNIKQDFLKLCDEKEKIIMDPEQVPIWFFQQVKTSAIIEMQNPIIELKACKNDIEIKGIQKAHELDAIAVNEFINWIKKHYPTTELAAADKLLKIRQQHQAFQYSSFNTISAFGANGAIIHYNANDRTNKTVDASNLYLVDSGGQYLCGTTDVTRTIALGKPTKQQILYYTMTLKGHIALAMAHFPQGTTGGQIDSLARQYLWQNGIDYPHGTGHGVGHVSLVHEYPPSIGKGAGAIKSVLKPGMVISNEPGVYIEGEYGIRIENLMLVVKSKYTDFLCFNMLTFVQLEKKLVDYALLTTDEKKWVTWYNRHVVRIMKKHNVYNYI